MGHSLLLTLCATLAFAAPALAEWQDEAISIGVRTSIESEILGETRPLEIRLPEHYDEELDRSYPLLVVLDGGSLFQYMVSIFDMIAPNHLPEMIVVGIPNTNRGRDLNVLDGESTQVAEGALRFMLFLEEELFVHLADEYRVLPHRVLVGHSLAGLFTMQCLFTWPDLFQGYIATSPSLGDELRERILLSAIDSVDPRQCAGKSLFLSIGGAESVAAQDACERVARLVADQDELGIALEWERFEGEGHIPFKGAYQGIRTLFDGWLPATEQLMAGELESILAHYSSLSRRVGFEVRPPLDVLGMVADRKDAAGERRAAIDAYRALLAHHPNTASARTALRRLLAEQEEIDAARRDCEALLAQNPDDVDAWNELARIGFPDVRGPFLGQERPGLLPERFAPFMLPASCNKHSALAFSADGEQLYLSVYPDGSRRQTIVTLGQVDGRWSAPHAASFSGQYNEGGPVFSPSGRRLYYYSKRPQASTDPAREEADVWFVERDESAGWVEPQHVDAPVSSSVSDIPFRFGSDGRLFLTRIRDRQPFLLRVDLAGDVDPEELKCLAYRDEFFEAVDMGGEDYFIFDVNRRVAEGYYESALFIAYRTSDGSWTEPKSVGDMINRGEGRFPSLSADGELLFFTSYRTGQAEHYWMDAAVIDYLRTNDLNLIYELVFAVESEGAGDGATEGLRARCADLKRRHSDHYAFDARLLEEVAARLVEERLFDEAQAVRRLNQQLHPD